MHIHPAEVERRLAKAYLEVLGDGEARTPAQKTVWADIESFCRAHRLSCEAIAGGEFSENNTLVNEGRRSFWLRARGQIIIAQQPEPEPIKISRQRKTSKH